MSAHEEALGAFQAGENERARQLSELAYVELHDGRPDRARELFRQAREEARQIGYTELNPYLLGDIAMIAAIDADPATAARLAGAAAGAFLAAGQVPDRDDAAEQERLREQLARELGADRFASLYEEGTRLTPAEVLGGREGGGPV